MPTEIADAPRLEAMAMCRGAPLAIEDAGDHGIGTLADAAKGRVAAIASKAAGVMAMRIIRD